MRLILIIIFIFTFWQCQNSPSEQAKADSGNNKDTVEVYGEDFTPQSPIKPGELPQKIAGKQKVYAQVEGMVKKVCQKKGCWMTLPLTDTTDIRVTFKNYGFFVPKNIAGRKVVMNGYAYHDTVTVEMRKHFARDAGKPDSVIQQITEPRSQIAYKATGVRLLPEK